MSSFPEILVLPVDESAHGSRARLECMFDAHHEFIWRLLRRLGLRPERADDATQQVFLVAAERILDIRKGSERAFLFGSALRVARAFLRSEYRLVLDGDMDHRIRGVPTPEDIYQRRCAVDVLDRALATMDMELRTVFILFELEGLTMAEIAALTDQPPGTVASRLRRARVALRAALAGADQAPEEGGES